jgi:hypothetical protein
MAKDIAGKALFHFLIFLSRNSMDFLPTFPSHPEFVLLQKFLEPSRPGEEGVQLVEVPA